MFFYVRVNYLALKIAYCCTLSCFKLFTRNKGKPLDLTLTPMMANVVANSTLEMEEQPVNSNETAMIAVSFLNGKRVKGTFSLFKTIYEIINELSASSPGIEGDMWENEEIAPTIIFIQREVSDFSLTIADLGITKGSYLLRLVKKPSATSFDACRTYHKSIRSSALLGETERQKRYRKWLLQNQAQPVIKQQNISVEQNKNITNTEQQQQILKKDKLIDTAKENFGYNSSQMDTKTKNSSQPTFVNVSEEDIEEEHTPIDMKALRKEVLREQRMSTLSKVQGNSSQNQVPSQQAGIVIDWDAPLPEIYKTQLEKDKEEDNAASIMDGKENFSEFSVYLPAEECTYEEIDVPDEYFEPTLDELRDLLKHEKELKKGQTEFLKTSEMRERESFEKLKKFKTATFRIKFPNGFEVQREFNSHSSLNSLFAFVKTLIVDPEKPFILYTLPVYTELMDTKAKTFFQSKLIPATVVFFKWKDETETEKYINEETKAKAQKREKSHIEFPPLPKSSTSLEMNERKEEKSVDDKPKHVNNFNNKSRETKNVPVWFLKGKRF